eukprot:6202776-Pleurochrysis_carterae.AAC.3
MPKSIQRVWHASSIKGSGMHGTDETVILPEAYRAKEAAAQLMDDILEAVVPAACAYRCSAGYHVLKKASSINSAIPETGR